MHTLPTLFRQRVALHPDRVALRVLAAGGAPLDETLTWREWEARSRAVAAALVRSGVRPGERVAVLGGNRPLWPVADLGILMAAGVSVGLYPTAAPEQVRQILADSGAVAAICDDAGQLGKLLAVRAALPALRTVVCQDAGAAGVLPWELWLRGVGGEREAEERLAAARPGEDAVLIYTSGSTGEPKGARVSHRYLLASCASIRETLGLGEGDTSLSFLPFCHAAERVFGLYSRIACGMEAGMVEDPSRVWEAARAFGPTLFGGLPRFYEKVYEALRAEELAAPPALRARWGRVVALGRVVAEARRAGRTAPVEALAEWRALGAPILARAREHFGGRMRLATSGGAALPAEVAEYLDALGVTVLGAYGLTEHLCVAFNRPDRYAFDSAGPPMPGSEVRIAEDGEILVRRSDLTFSGYHGRPEETRETFSPDGEWLLTGDLGRVGADGCLRVTGRKKELIALSTGKKVAPLPIEVRLLGDPLIGQAVVTGEGRKYVTALLALRAPALEAWARESGVEAGGEALLRHPALLARLQETIDAVNADLSRTERIRRFLVLERELSVERDELTPTLKVRRPVVAERYREQLDALYLLPEP